MKKNAIVISISIIILLSSCIFFQSIDQPSVSLPNKIITVSITASTEGGEYEPYFGICIPIGWTIPGDSIQCSGEYDEVIYYDDTLSIEQENGSPAPEGYYWWVGKGVADTSALGVVYGELQIQIDSQTGRFSIDYMLGNSWDGLNNQRSDDHLIEIVEENKPWGLRAVVAGDSVIINWGQPFNTSGLLGYNIYRDQQQINTLLITDTTFIDENPLEGIHYYTVSSYYSNSSEYLTYEVQVMLGNSLCVSPNGSNNNSGSSFGEALLTIDFAISAIIPDSLNHKTIYLSQGIFSPSTTGDVFPLEWKNHLSLEGISEEVTILDGESLSGVIQFNDITDSKIKNIKIRNGYAENGGGIYCSGSDPELVNVIITNNSALEEGGGIHMWGNAKLTNVIISNNSGNWGGGIYMGGVVSATLTNVLISNNSAGAGGGIYTANRNAILTNIIISNNSAGAGGGIYMLDDATLTNIIISNNSASRYGGAIVAVESDFNLVNVTVSNNSAGEYAGVLYMSHRSNSYFVNSIFWNNSPQTITFGQNTLMDDNSLSISYSDFQGGLDSIFTYNVNTVHWLEGNKDEDPLFVGTGDHPYTLSSGSPCIDSGDPNPIYNDTENPNNLGFALLPAMGTIRNDMGAYGGPNAASWNIVTDIEDDETEDFQIPTEFELSQNFPNPFNNSTTIQYGINERSSVELVMYDLLGRQVLVLVNEEQDAGYYKVRFNAGSLASGIYFYRLQAGDYIETKKMVLMK